MPNPIKAAFLDEVAKRFGTPRKLPHSESLFDVGRDGVRLYFRYSKKHPRNRTFYGLRKVDLQALEGHRGILCFVWDAQREPLFVPFDRFEEVFSAMTPANDGQFKAQVLEQPGGTELYLANAGRFNVESFFGWDFLATLVQADANTIPSLSHSQVQTLLSGIGAAKGFDIWVPQYDRARLDRTLAPGLRLTNLLPPALLRVKEIAEEIDVIWLERGGGNPAALYEVEHTTSIYSGLLRFNDIHLIMPNSPARFGIVANDARQALFVRQLDRPTFRASGLREICTFLEYRNVFGWHRRIQTTEQSHA